MIWASFEKCVEGTLYTFAIFIIQIKEVVVWSSRNIFFEKKPCSLRKHTLPYVPCGWTDVVVFGEIHSISSPLLRIKTNSIELLVF